MNDSMEYLLKGRKSCPKVLEVDIVTYFNIFI